MTFGQVYEKCFSDDVEQSAIYSDVDFRVIDEKGAGIVLTPECDIQQQKVETVLLARIVPLVDILEYWLVKKGLSHGVISGLEPLPDTGPRRKGLVKEFSKIYMTNRALQYFFLPGLDEVLDDSFVCYDITVTTKIDILASENKKLALLRSPFKEAVPVHFAAFMGRVGLPAVSNETLEEVVSTACRLTEPS